MSLMQLVDLVHKLTIAKTFNIVTVFQDTLLIAVNGQVCTYPHPDKEDAWRVGVAAKAAVWWLQDPNKAFESITSSVL